MKKNFIWQELILKINFFLLFHRNYHNGYYKVSINLVIRLKFYWNFFTFDNNFNAPIIILYITRIKISYNLFILFFYISLLIFHIFT